ncbi:hypothetical protein [Nonomuraea jabiensis]|uniref:hypothetical protein n=1 Tax=Nonomuraea jabiensis TaxID=882448 RepID=UPI003D759E4B
MTGCSSPGTRAARRYRRGPFRHARIPASSDAARTPHTGSPKGTWRPLTTSFPGFARRSAGLSAAARSQAVSSGRWSRSSRDATVRCGSSAAPYGISWPTRFRLSTTSTSPERCWPASSTHWPPEILALNDLGDHRPRVSPGRVLSVEDGEPGSGRVIEYKALSQHGFRFPASGGDLLDDVGTRDLTVNGLYYDLRHHLLIDPSGKGVRQLRATPRVLAPVCDGDDPAEQAKVVIRAVKFAVRWPDADVSELAAWARRHLADAAGELPADVRRRLRGFWGRCVPKEQTAQALRAAERLGPAAVELIQAVREGGCHGG